VCSREKSLRVGAEFYNWRAVLWGREKKKITFRGVLLGRSFEVSGGRAA
jgi:hypothetical protein